MVTLRHALLAVASVLVLSAGIYLWFEVRASPAAAEVAPGKRPGTEAQATAPTLEPAEVELVGAKPAAVLGRAGRPGVGSAGANRSPRINDPAPPPIEADPGTARPTPKLDEIMGEANMAYDRGDFDDAKVIAAKVLAKAPGNVRMLRILVSSSCIDGDNAEAQKAYVQLPPSDRATMKVRCARYGVTFTEP